MIINTSASFTRPADTTAYAANDLIANSTTAGSVTPMSFSVARLGCGQGRIMRIRLFSDNEAVTLATFSLHLFNASPTVTNGDNGAFAVATARTFLGTVAADMATGSFVTTTDKMKAFAVSPENPFDLKNASNVERRIFGLLMAGAGYTPASGELFEVTLEISSDS